METQVRILNKLKSCCRPKLETISQPAEDNLAFLQFKAQPPFKMAESTDIKLVTWYNHNLIMWYSPLATSRRSYIM